MNAFKVLAMRRSRRWLASVTFVLLLSIFSLPVPRHEAIDAPLIDAGSSMAVRPYEGRLFEAVPYRPVARQGLTESRQYHLLAVATDFYRRWERDRATAHGQLAGAALLLAGRTNDAADLFGATLLYSTGEGDLVDAVHHSTDDAFLTDFSAALLAKAAATGDAKPLLLAYEAADRAYRLRRTPQALWDRALAIERLGFAALAATAWTEAAKSTGSSLWSREAEERRAGAGTRALAPPPTSEELFFQQELITRIAGVVERDGADLGPLVEAAHRREVIAGDHLATDTVVSLENMRTGAERRRVLAAARAFTRGRAAVDADRLAEGLDAFRETERTLQSVHFPLALLARDQRIRCECGLRNPSCLDHFRVLRADLEHSGRYPWLTARVVYAIGQTYYRQGRIYEAAEAFRAAQAGLRRTKDAAGEALMHSLLANVLAMAGETDLALGHYLEGIRLPAPPIGDRRRRQLGDFTVFLLRHGFISTTELLLDELDRWPATDEGRVEAATLRGVVQARRGNAAAANAELQRAHVLSDRVADPTVREEVRNALAVAEAGARVYAPAASLADLDAAIARHERFGSTAMLPQLLAERGALLERHGERARAKEDYLRAMAILEARAPRVDEMLMGFGIDSGSDSPFDRAIRLLLNDGKLADALLVADRAVVLRISGLYARAAGLRDPFGHRHETVAGDLLVALRQKLGPDETMVVQHLLRDELISWIVTPTSLGVARRRVAAPRLIAAIEQLRQCTAKRTCRDGRGLNEVSDLLVRGWIDRVASDTMLIIAPPPDLKSIPYPMLTTRAGEPLIRRNALVTTPGLRAYVRAVQSDASRHGGVTSFFAAAPRPGADRAPLPLASREATLAALAYHGGAVVDTATTRASFLDRAPSFSVIHFAGHAVVNPQQPLLSALVFQPGEPQLLYIHEIEGRTFANARLVVLSGCETGVAPQPTMSIAHALLDQGVPSVVYTSWPVADEAAEEFAVEFHRAIAEGKSRAAALREADLSLLRNHFDHPEWWAAFEISGATGPLVNERKGANP